MNSLPGAKYYEADQEGYYHLYYMRKPWARLPAPLGEDEYYNPPQMNGGKSWRHSGRFRLIYLRKKFKWESLHA